MDKDKASTPTTPGKLPADRIGKFDKLRFSSPFPRQNTSAVSTKPNDQPLNKASAVSVKPNDQPLPTNPLFHSPMVLVSSVEGKPQCEEETMKKLNQIEKTLNVVAVVGTLRTGKSFILNKLATHSAVDNKSYFETGSSPTPVTKGIWVLCRPHPTQKDQVLVLLDTEGIDDPDKVEIEDDNNWFILSTLLSNTMVYNTRGNFDRTAIDKFKFLSKIKTSVKVSESEEDDSILDFFFPNFVLSLRDVTLEDQIDDDSFLENRLNLTSGEEQPNSKRDSLKEFNLPRILIRRYFKNRKCFRFKLPASSEKLKSLMAVPENNLEEEFQKTLGKFRSYILSCQPKTLKSGKAVNGRMFTALLSNYVTALQRGEAPCLTIAMSSMAQVENTHVVTKATDVYKAEMKKRLGSYTPSEKGLDNYHMDSMKKAVEILKAELVIDDEQIYEEKAMNSFQRHFEQFMSIARSSTKEECQNILRKLDTLKIQPKIKNRKYCTPSGYNEYIKDIEMLEKQFLREAPRFGSVAINVLQTFLDEKVKEEQMVYEMVTKATELQGKKTLPMENCISVYKENLKKTLKEEEKEEKKRKEIVEEDVKADIEKLQVDGHRNIAEEYFRMLKTKIEELGRVRNELTCSHPHYVQLLKETKIWKDIFDKLVTDVSFKDTIDQLWGRTTKDSIEAHDVRVKNKEGKCPIM